MKKVVEEYKQCICSILMSKYNLYESEAMKAIHDSYFDESLRISEKDTLHTDPEEWADDIFEYISGKDSEIKN